MRKQVSISLYLSEDQKTVTVHVSGRHDPIVSPCLGADFDADGRATVVYLNALIHPAFRAESYTGWIPTGAISTILTRLNANVVDAS